MKAAGFRRMVDLVASARIVPLLILAPIVGGCRTEVRSQRPADEPAWLTKLIRELERQPVANPPLFVNEYRYRGQRVYYVPAECCDVPSTLYDSTGAKLCSPDGGFAGVGDGKCADFIKAREQERRVWQDPRPPQRG